MIRPRAIAPLFFDRNGRRIYDIYDAWRKTLAMAPADPRLFHDLRRYGACCPGKSPVFSTSRGGLVPASVGLPPDQGETLWLAETLVDINEAGLT